MAVTVTFADWHDCVHIINCLMSVADTRGPEGAVLAHRLERIAHDLGDAVDACPVRDWPEVTRPIRTKPGYRTSDKEVDAAGYV